MKNIVTGCTLILVAVACTPGEKQAARTALDVTQAACVIANSAFPEEKVQAICGVVGPLVGPMRTLLASTKAAGVSRPSAGPVVCVGADTSVTCHATPAGP